MTNRGFITASGGRGAARRDFLTRLLEKRLRKMLSPWNLRVGLGEKELWNRPSNVLKLKAVAFHFFACCYCTGIHHRSCAE